MFEPKNTVPNGQGAINMYTSKTISLEGAFCHKSATIYQNPDVTVCACILYFHGGGLLYGSRCDLPETHLERFTSAGFPVIAFDYPLAPDCDLKAILADVIDSVNFYLTDPASFAESLNSDLPYILFGRSSGAYLALLAAASLGTHEFPVPADHPALKKAPLAVLSYYGYGFLEDLWYETPSSYYQSLPPVSKSILDLLPKEPHCEGPLDTHYSAYVYARQSGKWKSLFYHDREKFFLLYYSLRLCSELPCQLFCAHSTGDTDVPFAEFQKLSEKYHAQRFIASGSQHDFDRDSEGAQTQALLNETLAFLQTLV